MKTRGHLHILMTSLISGIQGFSFIHSQSKYSPTYSAPSLTPSASYQPSTPLVFLFPLQASSFEFPIIPNLFSHLSTDSVNKHLFFFSLFEIFDRSRSRSLSSIHLYCISVILKTLICFSILIWVRRDFHFVMSSVIEMQKVTLFSFLCV